MMILTTPRLRLEAFDDGHLDGLNELNADQEVMRYLTGRPESRAETQALIARVKSRWREVGYSWWTLFERETGAIVGAACLQNLRRESVAQPDPDHPLEIGWRLRRDRWGRGYASEAALAVGDWAFDALQPRELLAVCHPDNAASQGVMRRLGMRDDGVQRWYGQAMSTWRIAAGDWRDRRVQRLTDASR